MIATCRQLVPHKHLKIADVGLEAYLASDNRAFQPITAENTHCRALTGGAGGLGLCTCA